MLLLREFAEHRMLVRISHVYARLDVVRNNTMASLLALLANTPLGWGSGVWMLMLLLSDDMDGKHGAEGWQSISSSGVRAEGNI